MNDVVTEYLKRVKCEKTSRMFGSGGSGENDYSKPLKKFVKFLKRKDEEKQNRIEDDLGFEINFGAFQPAIKVRFCQLFLNNYYRDLSCHPMAPRKHIRVPRQKPKNERRIFRKSL